MNEKQNLFVDFSGLSKEEWEEKVIKELKGRPLADLEWKIDENIAIAPFYQKNALSSVKTTPFFDRDKNDWKIGEQFSVQDAKATNLMALDALKTGIEAPSFVWATSPSSFDLSSLLANIECAYISTNFELSENKLELLKAFHQVQKERGSDCKALQGSINGSITASDKSAIELLRFGIECLPQFQLLTMSSDDLSKEKGVAEEIANLLSRASDAFYFAQQEGVKLEEVAPRIQFDVSIGTSYFVEMAKLRALRLLWPLVLKGFGIRNDIPTKIAVGLTPDSQVEDRELNLIRASTQAMAAVLGGADRLTILPADAYTQAASAFAKRMSRNIQHILKMESYLDRVLDPAKGSYYIEMMTHKIAKQAWSKFQEMEKGK